MWIIRIEIAFKTQKWFIEFACGPTKANNGSFRVQTTEKQSNLDKLIFAAEYEFVVVAKEFLSTISKSLWVFSLRFYYIKKIMASLIWFIVMIKNPGKNHYNVNY